MSWSLFSVSADAPEVFLLFPSHSGLALVFAQLPAIFLLICGMLRVLYISCVFSGCESLIRYVYLEYFLPVYDFPVS